MGERNKIFKWCIKMATIKYYPVGNGDTTLIKLDDGTTILIDCNIRDCDQGQAFFDVKTDLLQAIARRNEKPFVDVFILSHGDCDHCRGFKLHFYQGDPKDYGEANRKAGEIIVDEMWFSPMIAERHTNEDEDVYQTEAERRLDLHRKNSRDKDLPGNRIRIIGYDLMKQYADLNHLRSLPGDEVFVFNQRAQASFSIFVHAPFKEHLISDEKSKNSASIVFQARFRSTRDLVNFTGLAMFGGDSDHESWRIILEKTSKYGNDTTKRALDYDLFLAPHHCSWSFFNNTPQQDNPIPRKTSLEVLDYLRKGAKVIASSKEIKDDDDNPPHYEARREYEKKVGAGNLLNTATFKVQDGVPQPIVFQITDDGCHLIEEASDGRDAKIRKATAIATSGLVQKPWCGWDE